MGTDFEKWFAETDWWHENSRREGFRKIWDQLSAMGIDDNHIADILDRVIAEMRDEYGE